MASIAEVNEINLDNSSVEAWGESVSGIEFDNYLNLKEGNDLQKINVTGKCSITADDVAILFKGRGKIDGSGTLEVASKNKTAISLDYCYSKNKTCRDHVADPETTVPHIFRHLRMCRSHILDDVP